MSAPVLSFDRVSYDHPDGARGLRDVRFDVRPGEFVVLAGASGSGKSTLLHAACGLAPHHRGGTLAGHVRVAGRDTRDAGPAELAAVVGTVLQDPETQVVLNTVRAELALPLELRGRTASAVAVAVEEVALALGIEALLDRGTHALSGGELQRVALGAALAAGSRPGLGAGAQADAGLRLLLLDEPTSQLDPVAGDELVWLLRRLNVEHGVAVVVAEHRLDRCLHHADRVIALDAGAVVCDAPPARFLAWAADAAPALLPPAARLFRAAGRAPLPVGVRDAREALAVGAGCGEAAAASGEAPAGSGVAPAGNGEAAAGSGEAPPTNDRPAPSAPAPGGGTASPVARRGLLRRRPVPSAAAPAVRARGAWREIVDGPTVLRDVDLSLAPGERVALLGRNGAGKSTLLRLLAGLDRPTRGRVERSGPMALLPQHPADVLLHDRVGDEAPAAALRLVGLDAHADRHPRDLSGGERQRLALAVVLGGTTPPVALGLDEPTRGMDAAARAALLRELRRLTDAGTAVVVATHDVEFAAELADRALLLGGGRIVADGPPGELLGGGWYFATQTARILADGRSLTPEQGAARIGLAAQGRA